MKRGEALTSADLVTFKSVEEEEEEGFIGIDDDGRLILKPKDKNHGTKSLLSG
jgi:hypothetical protein